MKAYKVKFIDDTEYSVRFHNTGGVTLVDNNGEHEVGTWIKPKNDSCCYTCFMFDSNKHLKNWKQKNLADNVAVVWRKMKKKRN